MNKAKRPVAHIPRPHGDDAFDIYPQMATTWSKVMPLMLNQLFEARSFVETGEYGWRLA